MDKTIDMTYRFLWDSEPTDEQLLVIMQEVGEDVHQSREKIAKQVLRNIENEYARALSEQKLQQT
jgi:hypothetical protein